MTGFPATFLPGVAGVMAAIAIADLFDSFMLLEARVWFVSLLISYTHLLKIDSENTQERIAPAKLLDPRPA
jgi:hypothetical protein